MGNRKDERIEIIASPSQPDISVISVILNFKRFFSPPLSLFQTRSHSLTRSMTRHPRSSSSSSTNKFDVFEFNEQEEKIEKASQRLLGKFKNPSTSPISKYQFLQVCKSFHSALSIFASASFSSLSFYFAFAIFGSVQLRVVPQLYPIMLPLIRLTSTMKVWIIIHAQTSFFKCLIIVSFSFLSSFL